MRVVNRTKGERPRKAKEDKKRKKQWKLQAWEQGEDTENDDDDGGDDNKVMEEEEMVVDDIKWDNLENEDALTGGGSSLQASGPFLFHGGEGTSREPMEVGRTVGLP